MTITREKAIEIARAAAKRKPQSYVEEPFMPHEWVIDAIMYASEEYEKNDVIAWMIQDQHGSVYIDENCLWMNREDAQEEANRFNEEDPELKFAPFIVVGRSVLPCAVCSEPNRWDVKSGVCLRCQTGDEKAERVFLPDDITGTPEKKS